MNFSESVLFSDISYNENENENEISENLIYIGAYIGSLFGILILFIRYICRTKKELNVISEISI
jgi:hypothetical protein